MTIEEGTNRINQIAMDVDTMSPPAKLARATLESGATVALPAQKQSAPTVTFDPSIPVLDNTMKPKKIILVPTNVAPATFAPPVTGKTPKKTKKAIDDNTAPSVIKDRWEHCAGTPLRVYKFHRDGSRVTHVCCMCKKGQTSWYCIGCKSWFCLSASKDTDTREKTFVYQNIKGEEVVFEMSCYHQKHQAAWERAEGKEHFDLTVTKIEECEECASDLESLEICTIWACRPFPYFSSSKTC